MECEPLKKVTLTEQIMEQIAGMITSGQLKPGDKLPNERDLAELFGDTGGVKGPFSCGNADHQTRRRQFRQ